MSNRSHEDHILEKVKDYAVIICSWGAHVVRCLENKYRRGRDQEKINSC